jgi:hypothetical protein
LEHVQIHDTGNTLALLRAVRNMFQGDTWIFTAPDPVAMGIHHTTDMKCVLIIDNYGVQKSLIDVTVHNFVTVNN